jgi:alpha-tubulin suppressor-like RCC1 family protein
VRLVAGRRAPRARHRGPVGRGAIAIALGAAALAAGCNAISGLGDLHVVEGGGGGGGAPATTTSSATTSGGGGATTTASGHGGAGGASTSHGGSGGRGGTGPCSGPSDCPASADGCATPTCTAGTCGLSNVAKDTLSEKQTSGDCRKSVCDGQGQATELPDDQDVPSSGNPCAGDGCLAGVPQHPPKPAGTSCSEGNGTVCDGAGSCVECIDGAGCPSGVCDKGACAAASCNDKLKNGDETDVDCGGSCPGCANGLACVLDVDCASLRCGPFGVCLAPSCIDGKKDGTETDVDCGGDACGPCASGKACLAHADCASEACLSKACASIVQIAAGVGHACALLGDGSAYCWGSSSAGQLGDGTTQGHPSPARVAFPAGMPKAAHLALGDPQGKGSLDAHSCALLADATVACWGDNSSGQLGVGLPDAMLASPTAVPKLGDVAQLDAGGSHTCARQSGGTVLCWGDNTFGQLGTGNYASSNVPVAVSLKVALAHVTTGARHTCAISPFATYCTGDNARGQLGLGDTSPRNALTAQNMFQSMSALAAGGAYSCGWESGGQPQCWGDDTTGELGNGGVSNLPGTKPVSVKQLSGSVTLVAGTDVLSATGAHTCALLASGGVDCWGANGSGQVGNGTTNGPVAIPNPVPGLANVAEVAVGGSFTCARLKTGALRCWGRNDAGQLGRGAASAQPGLTPEPVVWP